MAFDIGLALLMLIAAGDIGNRWGLNSPLWMLVYAATVFRILTVWPAYFRLLARNWTYLLYPTVCLASVIWSVARGVSLVGGIQLMMTVLIACFIGWRFNLRVLMFMAFTTTFLGSMFSMVNYVSGGALGQPLYSNVGGLLGIYTNKNMLGHYSLMATMLGLTFLLAPRAEVPTLFRRAAVVAVIVCPLAVILSKSITAVLLMPVYFGLTLLLNRKRLAGWIRYGIIAVIVLFIALVPALLALAEIDPLQVLFDTTGKDATLTGRTELWTIAANEIRKVPLTGYGFGAFWVADRFESLRFLVVQAGATAPSFHNVIADVGIGTGLLGITALVTLILTTITRAFRYWRLEGSAFSVGCLITVVAPINVAMLEPYLYRQHEFMLCWLVMMGVTIGRIRSTPSPVEKY